MRTQEEIKQRLNESDDFLGTKTANKLQKKADDIADKKLQNVIFNTDITSLSREEAKIKLKNAIDSAFEE